MYKYDFYSFIDSPDIREYLKTVELDPIQQSVLIAKSTCRSIEDKIDALQYLLDNYSDKEFEYEVEFYNKLEKHNFIETIKLNIKHWKSLLEKNKEENRIYAVYISEIGFDLENCADIYCNSYEDAYSYLVKNRIEYAEEYNSKIYGKIESFVINDADIRITNYFNTNLDVYNIDCCTYGNDDFRIYDYIIHHQIFIPTPFKRGDILKSVDFNKIEYCVFPEDWIYDEKRKCIFMEDTVSLDYGYLDHCSQRIKVYWDHDYLLNLQYCSKDELPEEYSILKYISDARLGECDWIRLLYDITNDYSTNEISNYYYTNKGFKK